MKITKRFFIVVSLAAMTLVPGVLNAGAQGESTHSQKPLRSSPSVTSGKVTPTRKLHYVSVQMQQPLQALIAGTKGRFALTARLNSRPNPSGKPLSWSRNADNPVVVWISAPPESGIGFVDEAHGGALRHHILVKFKRPPGVRSEPLTAQVGYTVNSQTKAGKHDFWMDVEAQVRNSASQEMQDIGSITLPFEVDTHLGTKLLMLLIVLATVFLFIVEWVRVDVVAIGVMVLLPQIALLNAKDTFRGLSSNAVVAIIGVMIISYALNRAGLVNRIIQPLLKYVGRSPHRLMVIFSSLIASISSVMQNTGAAVLFLPAIRLMASHRLKIPISRVLMPIGMAAILGGTMTMIGTSPLILLNSILPVGMPKFGFLELTPIGVALVIGGVLFLSTVGMVVLSKRSVGRSDPQGAATGNSGSSIMSSYPLVKGPFEIAVPETYQSGQGPQDVMGIRRRFLVNIVASAEANGTCEIAPLPYTSIHPGFTLCAYGPEKAVKKFTRDYGLTLKDEPQCFKDTMFNPSLAGVVEGVVSPRSTLIGQSIKDIGFRQTFGVNPLAIHQNGRTYYRQLADRPLQAGDTLLMHGTWEQFHGLQDHHQNFIIITPFEQEFHKPEKANRALGCFLVALFLMILSSFYFQKQPYNPIPLSVCLMVGAVGMVITRVITINEAYRAVDWRTVFLLGGLIPLGMAVDQTGTAQWLARGIVTGLGSFMSPLLLLIILACLSCAFTMVISNVGACILLVPLGMSIATQIGVDPRVAAIVVGLGVSNSFLLPTHQVNVLYMGAGGYQTTDYIKIGGLLSLLYITILVTMVYFFYL